jgi:outer membrane protein assembly factor BamA
MFTVNPLIALALCGLLGEQSLPLSGVEFEGNRHVPTAQLLDAFALKSGSALTAESLSTALERVLAVYIDSGYLFASALPEETPSGDSLKVVIRLDEGEKYVVGHLGIEGNTSLSTGLLMSQMDTGAGKPFVQRVFQDDMQRLLTLYENYGHAFAQVIPQGVSYDTLGHKIDIHLQVIEGQRVRFAGARVEGARISKPEYLAREAGIKPGEYYRANSLERARRRLEKIPFITQAGEFELLRAGSTDMVWARTAVKERTMNSVYGVLGYEPDGEASFTGLLSLSMENLTGRGRSLKAEWQRPGVLSSRLEIVYGEPFVLAYDVGLELAFSHYIRDTSYTKSSVSAAFHTRSALPLGLSWGISYDRVLPGSFPVANSRSYGVMAGVTVDTRDNPRAARSGILYDVRGEYALRRMSPTELVREPDPSANTAKLFLDLVNYFPSYSRQLFYACVRGREAYTSEGQVPLDDYFRLGGATSVRGYGEDQFEGFRVAWANLEYRLGLGREAFFYPFLDLGYYEALESHGVLGYGAGLSAGRGAAGFGMDYGLARGEGPLDGKVHLRLTGEF